jgi:hypothetical protein
MKHGQMQVGFNWIFILIAGAVILLFFAGIVIKQKDVSEKTLSIDVVTTLDSIFTAAQVSDKTTNIIPLGGLSKETLQFDCEDGVSEFSLLDQSFRETNSIDPLFAQAELQGNQLLLLSLPYNFPYKIQNFLMLSTPSVLHIIVGKTNQEFLEEFLNQTKGFNVKYLADGDLEQIDVGANNHVRIIDLDGGNIVSGTSTPQSLSSLSDHQVTAVSFSGKTVTHYNRKGNTWNNNGDTPLLSIPGTRDAAKYGAIFAGNSRVYWCNMEKTLTRINHLNLIYDSKVDQMISYYDQKGEFICKSIVEDVKSTMDQYNSYVSICKPGTCEGLTDRAEGIRELNTKLRTQSCSVQLY